MKHPLWFEHFKDKLPGLTAAYESNRSHLSLLGFALKNGFLSFEDYKAWAQRQFSMALLNDSFFTEVMPQRELFSKWSSHYAWSSECLPVAEWDGTLIVAALEPPKGLPQDPPFICVLTSLVNLEKTWHEYQELVDENFSIEILEKELTNSHYAKIETGKKDAQENVEELTAIEYLEKELGQSPVNHDPNSEDPFNIENDSPSVFDFPVPEFRPQSTVLASSTIGQDSFFLNSINQENPIFLTEKIKSTFEKMKTHFEKSMILSLNKDENQAVVFAYDDSFKINDRNSPSGSVDSIPLDNPSIFNIVSKTSKPFHGYISLNQINEHFFQQWNNGLIPEHVTIAPICYQEKVVGMLVGLAHKSAYNKVSLNLAEMLSNQFLQNLPAA